MMKIRKNPPKIFPASARAQQPNMKKIFTIVLFTLLATVCWGQDTVYKGDGRYLMPLGLNPSGVGDSLTFRHRHFICWRQGDYRVQDTTTIYGIAIALQDSALGYVLDHYYDEIEQEDSVVLDILKADWDNHQVEVVERCDLTSAELLDAYRHKKIFQIVEGCSTYHHLAVTRPNAYPLINDMVLVELYFSRPLKMQGEFYFAARSRIPRVNQSIPPRSNDMVCALSNKYESLRIDYDVNNPSDFLAVPEPLHYIFPILLTPMEDNPDEGVAPQSALRLAEKNVERRYATIDYDRNPEVGGQQLAFAPWPADPDSVSPITRPRSQINSYTFSNLDPEQTYAVWLRDQCYYRYTAHKDTAYYGPWSEPLLFSLTGNPGEPDTTGLLSPAALALDIFPNPTSGELTISCPEAEIHSVELLDPQGRLLQRWESCSAPLRLHHPRGTYLLRVHTSRGTVTRPVVKE